MPGYLNAGRKSAQNVPRQLEDGDLGFSWDPRRRTSGPKSGPKGGREMMHSGQFPLRILAGIPQKTLWIPARRESELLRRRLRMSNRLLRWTDREKTTGCYVHTSPFHGQWKGGCVDVDQIKITFPFLFSVLFSFCLFLGRSCFYLPAGGPG